MDSGSTLKHLFLHQSWNLGNSWSPFRGREQEPVYSALAGTVITAPPCKTNEHLCVCAPACEQSVLSFAQQCSWHLCPACAIPAVHHAGMGKTQSTAWASPTCKKQGLVWGKTSAVQCSDAICAAGPNTGLRLLKKNQVLGDLEK